MTDTKKTDAHDNGTRTVQLPRPVTVEGMGQITELTLRPPVARDLYRVSLVDLATSQIGPLMEIGSRIHTPRLPPEAWAGLELGATLAIAGTVGGFFADLAPEMGLDLEALAAGANPSST